MPRPNGETAYSFRPDAPDPKDPGRKYEQPSKHYGGPGNVLGVYPTSPGLLGDASVPLHFVEGVKKAMSEVSACKKAGRELVVVAISGVWNWLSKGAPIPDMAGLLVEGRECVVVFDSDMLRNPGVQGAARRLSEYLIGRGATVRVAYLRDGADSSKTGVDDFFAAGGTLGELEALMRPYDPDDFAVVRLERDTKLARAIEAVERRFWAMSWTCMAGGTDRDVALALMRAARKHGTLVEGGIRVVKSWGDLLIEAGISSRRTISKSLGRLEGRSFLKKDNEGRKAGEAGAFVLRAGVNHYGTGRGQEEKATEVLRGWHPLGLHLRASRLEDLRRDGKGEESAGGGLPMPDLSGREGVGSPVPRLRWSSPPYKGRLGLVRDTRMVRQGVRERSRSGLKRLGKTRGAILDILHAHGGAATVAEIGVSVGTKKPCEFARRHLPALAGAGLIAVEGRGKSKVATLCDGWLELLEKVRELGEEPKADEATRRSVARQREAYHNRHKVVPNHHPANRDADGWVEDLERIEEGVGTVENEGCIEDEAPNISPLARVLEGYLEKNPHDACQRPYWLGTTLWAFGHFPGKPTPDEVSAALEELGGEAYRRSLLARESVAV